MLAALAITLLAFALRVYHLDGQSLWYDEGFSVYLAQKSLLEMTTRTAADIQPPLYYCVLHVWMRLAGRSEFAVRFLSLLFGTVTVPLIFVLGRRLAGERVGLLAASLLAVSPFHVWYAQETRMYTLVTLLGVLSSWLLLRAIGAGRVDMVPTGGVVDGGDAAQESAAHTGWLLYAIANVAAVYSHYYAFFLVAFQTVFLFLWWLVHGQPGRVLARGVLAQVACILAYLPWAGFALNRYAVDESYWEGTLSLDFVRKTLLAFATGHTVYESQANVITVGYVILVLVGLAALLASRQRPMVDAGIFALLYLCLPFFLLYSLSAYRPKFNPRYLMLASPPFFLLIAAGAAKLWATPACRLAARLLAACAVLYVLITSAYALHANYANRVLVRDDFRSVAARIRREMQPDEAIVLCSGHLFPVFSYYYTQSEPYRIPEAETLSARAVISYGVADRLNEIAARHGGVWLVLWQNEVVDPNGILAGLLDAQAEQREVPGGFWGIELRHYRFAPGARFAPPVIAHERNVNFGNRLTLLGITLDERSVPSGQPLAATLFWQAQGPLDEDYWLSLHLVDASGHVFGRLDQRPASYTYPTMRWQAGITVPGRVSLPVLAGTPPGEYSLLASVYVPARGQSLDVMDARGAPAGVSVELVSVRIGAALVPPSIASLGLARPMSVVMASGVELVATDLADRSAQQGETITFQLAWRSTESIAEDYRLAIRLVGPQGGVLLENLLPLAGADYPTSVWPVGSVIRGWYGLAVPADAPPAQAALEVGFCDASGQAVGQTVVLARLSVTAVNRLMTIPPIENPQRAQIGNLATLLGYDVTPTSVRPGQEVSLTLYWQARAGSDRTPYVVFTHLLGPDQRIYGQHDGIPGEGTRPTTGWLAGEVVVDGHRLQVRADTPRGEYMLEVGVYDPLTNVRLPVLDEGGATRDTRVVLTTRIRVQP